MDCSIFQDRITDYLDGELEGCAKAEFAAHRLRCRDCRQTFADVRETVEALNAYGQRDAVPSLESLEARILDATSAGEMLSCGDFDRLIEKFFDGVILGPTFQTFQAHFGQCVKCRRLMRGIEEAIELCYEAKAEVEVPDSLTHRILAATSGAPEVKTGGWRAKFSDAARTLWTPQWAAAALIFAAGGLFISARFGSLDNMADKAGAQAGRLVAGGQQAINQTEVMAASGMQLLAGGFVSAKNPEPKRAGTQPAPARTPQPTPAHNQPKE